MQVINNKTQSYLSKSEFIRGESSACSSMPSFKSNVSKTSNFNKFEDFTLFKKNNKDDLFIKAYLFNTLEKSGIKQPANIKITVISPLYIEEKIKHELHSLIFGDFKGYINYFFELMSEENKDKFVEKISQTRLSQETKNKLVNIYDYMDNFYQVKLSKDDTGKTYNLFNLSNKEGTELLNILNPEEKFFVNKLIEQTDSLKLLTRRFGRSEIERATLNEAGESSKNFIKHLIIGTISLAGLEHFRPTLVSMVGASTPLGRALDKSTEFVGGCGDDVLAGYKDYLQDEVTLGKSTAQKILLGGTLTGIITSGYAASIGVSSMIGSVIFANASSGSSIFSNLCAFCLLYKNFDKMIATGIIKPQKENMTKFEKFRYALKTAWKNYSAYDAYLGKVLGLAACTPVAVAVFKAGLFSSKFASPSKNAFAKALGLMILGSIESYIPMIVQYCGDNIRKAKMQSSKDQIVSGKAKPEQYNSRKYYIKGQSSWKNLGQLTRNFLNSY